jgi:arylsulfatase
LLAGKSKAVRGARDWIGWELFGNRAVRQGDWKILNLLRAAGGTGEWQLFNLKTDPAETHDLAKDNPKKLKELIALWNAYAKKNGVILTGDGPFKRGKEASVAEDLGD